MVEITDRKSLERWLEGKPQRVCVLIAARAALRVYPILLRHRVGGDEMKPHRLLHGVGGDEMKPQLLLTTSRAMLAAAAAERVGPPPK